MAIAQTFLNSIDEGVFVTSIDLYFSAKDDTLPITIGLLETRNDRPGSKILPFSAVTKAAADISTSTDAETATKFTFSSPVYLRGGYKYALGIETNSTNYSLYVSELGQNRIGTTRRISEQPLVGSLFKSQNQGAPIDMPLEDLKFTLRKAKFTTFTPATLELQNDALTAEDLDSNPIETNNTAGSGTAFGGNPKILKVNHVNHGMATGDTVTIAGVTGNASDTANGLPISEINASHTIANVTLDSYTITVTSSSTAKGVIGGSSVTATRNVPFEVLYPQIGQTMFPDTDAKHFVRATSKQSVHGSETGYTKISATNRRQVVPNDNYYYEAQQQIASPINETNNLSGNKSMTYDIVFSTANENVSPAIDLGRTNVIAVSNRMDSPTSGNTTGFKAETEAVGGSASAKYVTKEIQLTNPATALDIRVSANNHPTASIKVLYKIKRTTDNRSFDDIPYEFFNSDGSADDTVTYSETRTQTPYNQDYYDSFFEQKFTKEGLDEFSSFSIKIVMTGTNPAFAPRITDMRALALAV